MIPSLPDFGRVLTPERVRHYPLILLVGTVGVYLSGALRSRNLIEPDGRIVGHDYLAFYMAGDMVNRGELGGLYNFAAQEGYQKRFMEDINPKWSSTCLYLNPPHYAWAMSFPARLGYGPSLIVWWVLSAACFVVVVMLWRGWVGADSIKVPALLVVCLSSFFWAFSGGQNTFFSLLILTVFCALLMSGREFLAGLVLSALAFKFQLLVVPAGLLLLKRRWRAMIGLSIGGLATLGATIALMGQQSLFDYVRFAPELSRLLQIENFDVHKQHSWHGFFALVGKGWMPATTVRALSTAASVASLGLLVPIWRGSWRSGGARFALQLCALLVATLLTCPHLFHYDMLIITLPALLWLWAARLPDDPAPRRSIKTLLASGFVWLAVSPLVSGALHVQLSPLLMFAWLLVLRGEISSTAQGQPDPFVGPTFQSVSSDKGPPDRLESRSHMFSQTPRGDLALYC